MSNISMQGISRKVVKIATAIMVAAMISATPMVLDMTMDTDITSIAAAGRPQSGPGEY